MTYTLTVELLGTTEFIDGHISYRVPDHSNWLQKKSSRSNVGHFQRMSTLNFFPFGWNQNPKSL